jgi:elongation factor P--(R)-beta-lysine ligase
MSWWRPDGFAAKKPYLVGRDRVIQAVRRFFRELDFFEVDTPALQTSPGLEPHLMAFATELVSPNRESRRPLYLHTSPEFAMKKLLVAGVPRLFQMAKVFRNGERSATHHPEFTMLEWYRANAGYLDLMADCIELLRSAAKGAECDRLRWKGEEADPFAEWQVISVQEAFESFAGMNLLATCNDAVALGREASRIGVRVAEGDGWEDVFFRIFLDRIEPRLGIGAPTILYDYPISMAALSRPKAEDSRLAERFEVYVCGLELANAFGELTDPVVQRVRFEADMALKERLYGFRYPVDEDFLSALEHGMPESAGIALGIDRLAMLCTGAAHIEQVLWAPVAE